MSTQQTSFITVSALLLSDAQTAEGLFAAPTSLDGPSLNVLPGRGHEPARIKSRRNAVRLPPEVAHSTEEDSPTVPMAACVPRTVEMPTPPSGCCWPDELDTAHRADGESTTRLRPRHPRLREPSHRRITDHAA